MAQIKIHTHPSYDHYYEVPFDLIRIDPDDILYELTEAYVYGETLFCKVDNLYFGNKKKLEHIIEPVHGEISYVYLNGRRSLVSKITSYPIFYGDMVKVYLSKGKRFVRGRELLIVNVNKDGYDLQIVDIGATFFVPTIRIWKWVDLYQTLHIFR